MDSSDGYVRKAIRKAKKLANVVGDTTRNVVGDARRKVGDVYNHTKPKVQNLTRKFKDAYDYAKPKVQSVTRKVKEVVKQGYHTTKVKAVELKKTYVDNLLMQACLTGTPQEIDEAIMESINIRDKYLSTLKGDPNGTEIQHEVHVKNHDSEVERLIHLRQCMKSLFKTSSPSSSKSPSRLSSSKSPSRPSSSYKSPRPSSSPTSLPF
jgi:hypothetical protein